MTKYRVAFLGQKRIAEKCLKLLLQKSDIFSLELLVCDQSLEMVCSEYSSADSLEQLSNKERNEPAIVDKIHKKQINLLISVQHPWILSKEVIDAVSEFAFNLHNAKLPEYKGHGTISHALLNGESRYYSTLHWLAEKVDLGDVAYEQPVAIEDKDTAFSLYEKSLPNCVSVFKQFVDSLSNGAAIPRKDISSLPGTFYGKDEIFERKVIADLNDNQEVALKARAFYFPGFEPAYGLTRQGKQHVIPDYCSSYDW